MRLRNFPHRSQGITCRGTVDLSPGSDEDVNAGVGVRAGDVRREEVEVDVFSSGWETEHRATLLNINM